MKLHVLILMSLASIAAHAQQPKSRLMTPQAYTELCQIDHLFKDAADKKVVEFYNKSKWAIVPAGLSQQEVEAGYGVNSLNDLRFVRIDSGVEPDVQTQEDETQVYTGAIVVYTNKAGTEVQVRVARSKPLIARLVETSAAYQHFYANTADSTQSKELDAIDAYQVVEVSGDVRNREQFCDLKALEGLTHFKSKK